MTFIQFQDIFLPYTKYCSEQTQCQHYCRERHQENEVFTAYLAVCPPDHSKLRYYKHAFFEVFYIISVNIKIMLVSHESLTLYKDVSLLTTLASFLWSFCWYCQVYIKITCSLHAHISYFKILSRISLQSFSLAQCNVKYNLQLR